MQYLKDTQSSEFINNAESVKVKAHGGWGWTQPDLGKPKKYLCKCLRIPSALPDNHEQKLV